MLCVAIDFELHAGFSEKALAYFQVRATLPACSQLAHPQRLQVLAEFNFDVPEIVLTKPAAARLAFFEAFWEMEAPRVGDAASDVGWKVWLTEQLKRGGGGVAPAARQSRWDRTAAARPAGGGALAPAASAAAGDRRAALAGAYKAATSIELSARLIAEKDVDYDEVDGMATLADETGAWGVLGIRESGFRARPAPDAGAEAAPAGAGGGAGDPAPAPETEVLVYSVMHGYRIKIRLDDDDGGFYRKILGEMRDERRADEKEALQRAAADSLRPKPVSVDDEYVECVSRRARSVARDG